MKFTSLFSLFFLGTCYFLQAQLSIYGLVSDEETGLALPYASITLVKQKTGTLTNGDGQYSVKIPKANLDDSLLISFLGYADQKMNISELKPGELNFSMIRQEVSLEEVLIIPVTPEELLVQALAQRDENYFEKSTHLEAFYRELIQENDRFIVLNEAVLDIHKSPFSQEEDHPTTLKLIKSRSKKQESQMGNVTFNMGGGGPQGFAKANLHLQMMAEDFLTEKEFKFYDYTLHDIITYKGRQVYHISFDQKKKLRQKLYQGDIYLDFRSLAFVSIQYTSSDIGKKLRFKQFIGLGGRSALAMASLLGIKFSVEKHQARLDFQEINGSWYPSYAQGFLNITTTTPKNKEEPESPTLFKNHISREMVILQVQPDNQTPIPNNQLFTNDTPLSEMEEGFDDAFWEGYNVLRPTESLRKIAKDMEN